MMGLMPGSVAFLPEVERAEQVAVVGGGQGGHAQPFGLLEQLPQARRAVQHGVFGVGVQMDERVIAGSHRTILVPRPPMACPDASRPGGQACPDSSTSRA